MEFNSDYAQKLHRHVVIWLDEYIGLPASNEKMKDRFRRVTYPLETFTKVQPTIDFIRQQQAAQMSVFLIVSGQLALDIVPQVYDYNCVIQIFIFCAKIKNYTEWATQYIDKVLMFDFDEDLLIRLTNEIANYLTDEAEKYGKQDKVEFAAGLLDWAAWLYNDADTLQRAACKKMLANIKQRRQKLDIDYQIVYPNQFNN
ncbi:unnamed protein product [Rotaria sp. Silwood1]|nr:unnamed protein product [Rotaria sp. Silwood1]CAF1685534.1 unnamed protein product [Rotaria sp. Silwood1]